MGYYDDRINFFLEQRSMLELELATQAPRFTLEAVSRGAMPLPSQYQNDVRNAYQREAYRRMEQTGISPSQSDRFRWYNPEAVRGVIGEVEELKPQLAAGLADIWSYRAIEEDRPYDYLDLYADAEEAVTEGLFKSRKSLEEWEDYLRVEEL